MGDIIPSPVKRAKLIVGSRDQRGQRQSGGGERESGYFVQRAVAGMPSLCHATIRNVSLGFRRVRANRFSLLGMGKEFEVQQRDERNRAWQEIGLDQT